MPTYDFENTETGEQFEKLISISGKEDYLKENPNIKQIHVKFPASISGKEGSMLKQAGSGWKEVQDRIKGGLPPRLKGNIRTK
jgi:hypothetical protein